MHVDPKMFDSIVSSMDPREIDLEFILMAKVRDMDGVDHVLVGDDLAHMMKFPELYEIAEARVVLDIRRMKIALRDELEAIYAEISRRLGT
jgi:hypothetical protein